MLYRSAEEFLGEVWFVVQQHTKRLAIPPIVGIAVWRMARILTLLWGSLFPKSYRRLVLVTGILLFDRTRQRSQNISKIQTIVKVLPRIKNERRPLLSQCLAELFCAWGLSKRLYLFVYHSKEVRFSVEAMNTTSKIPNSLMGQTITAKKSSVSHKWAKVRWRKNALGTFTRGELSIFCLKSSIAQLIYISEVASKSYLLSRAFLSVPFIVIVALGEFFSVGAFSIYPIDFYGILQTTLLLLFGTFGKQRYDLSLLSGLVSRL